jgi:hypothetical protein
MTAVVNVSLHELVLEDPAASFYCQSVFSTQKIVFLNGNPILDPDNSQLILDRFG